MDFGVENAFHSLDGACMTKPDGGFFHYEVCPFHGVTQTEKVGPWVWTTRAYLFACSLAWHAR